MPAGRGAPRGGPSLPTSPLKGGRRVRWRPRARPCPAMAMSASRSEISKCDCPACSPHLLSPLEGGPGGMTRHPPTDCAPAGPPLPTSPLKGGRSQRVRGVVYLADVAVAGPGACSPHLLFSPWTFSPPPWKGGGREGGPAPAARGVSRAAGLSPPAPLPGGRREGGAAGAALWPVARPVGGGVNPPSRPPPSRGEERGRDLKCDCPGERSGGG